MTIINVVGGIYHEKCIFPYWDQLYGSAGRAAMVLVGSVDLVRLHSAITEDEECIAGTQFEGVELNMVRRQFKIGFDYLHSLSVPKITPALPVKQVKLPQIDGEIVVKYGMLEADPVIKAEFGIYDPQSAFSPLSFRQSGSTANHLAIIANEREVKKMGKSDALDDAVKAIQDVEKADVLVVKRGIEGALVFFNGGSVSVPAYKTKNAFLLGSGDVFVAAFAHAWAVQKLSAPDSARIASLAAADYVETRSVDSVRLSERASLHRDEAKRTGGRIYLAGPFRETGQRMLINDARLQLQGLGMTVFSPIHDIGPGDAALVVKQDLDAIQQCDAVFAILNGSSPGTVFEVGYARALGKPVFCVTQNMRDVDLKLPKGSGAFLHDDYVSALLQIAWRS